MQLRLHGKGWYPFSAAFKELMMNRNRKGLNDWVYEQQHPEERSSAS